MLPAATDLSREADIARVKYFRNTVYAHAENASVDDATFNTYWKEFRDSLVRLGGARFKVKCIQNVNTVVYVIRLYHKYYDPVAVFILFYFIYGEYTSTFVEVSDK